MDNEARYHIIWGYWNFCMDNYNGHASEQAIQEYLDEEYPESTTDDA